MEFKGKLVWIERHFYGIVRWFGLVGATAALAIALIAVFIGIFKVTHSPDTTVHRPSVGYADFRRAAELSRADNQPANQKVIELHDRNEAAAREAAEAEFEKRVTMHINAIVSKLASYASKTNQAKPAGEAVADYVRSGMQRIGRFGQENLPLQYLEDLDKATGDLEAHAHSLAKLETSDPRRVRWDNFLYWYTDQYEKQVSAELERIGAEKRKAFVDAAEAPMFFYAAAIAFVFFVLGTIILVLLRIELNTRSEF